MKRKGNKLLQFFNRYVVFFIIIAFVITCCLMLFVQTLMHTLGVSFTAQDLGEAAKLTFLNVMFCSLLITLFDWVRRRLTVDRYVDRIIRAADRLMQGNFSVRIAPIRGIGDDEHFNEIITCFNRMAQELAGIETLRTDFVSNVSHELKTPLAVIRNYATMLADPKITAEERAEYVRTISGASQRLSSLITNILRLNKLESQSIYPKAESYDLGEQLCACLLEFEDTWEKKNLNIETEIEDGITVSTDAELMTLVWNNLFSNAIKFTENGGTVSLTLASDGEDAVVSVADSGCGISADVGVHFFEKFYQGDTSHACEGNGLGLTLVKRVIDITGSEISVNSEVGKGTTFTVRIRRDQNGTV
jgi:signal transduction histidine kinase